MPEIPRPAAPKARRARADRPLRVFTRIFILLVASVGIWFYVQSQITATVPVTAPFQVRSPDPEVVVVGKGIPSTIRLLVTGPRSRIESLGEVRAWINVRKEDRTATPFAVSLKKKIQTDLPPGFEVSLDPDAPSELNGLQLDRWEIQSVPVIVRLKNEESLAPRGLKFGTPPYRIVPSRVPVRVPRSAAAGSLALRALPVDLANAGPEHSETLVFEESSGLKPNEPVRIHLNLVAVQEKQIENVPVRVLAPPGYPFVCSLEERDRMIPALRLVGDPAVVRALTAADVVAFIPAPDPAKVQPGEPYAEEVRFHLPPGVSIANASPLRVNLTLKAAEKKE